MSKRKLKNESLDLIKSSGAFYARVVQTTQSLDADTMGMSKSDAQKLEVQPTIFYRINGELNNKYYVLSAAFLEIQNELLNEIQVIFDEHEIPPEDADLLLDLTDKFHEHRKALEPTIYDGVYVDDRVDNVNNSASTSEALLRSPGKRRPKSFAGNPFFALDQRLKAMIGDIRAIEFDKSSEGASLADKLEHLLINKRRQGLFPRDYQRDVMPVLGEYIEQSFTQSDFSGKDLHAAPWVSDVMNALVEETGNLSDDVNKASDKGRFEDFINFIETLLGEAQKNRKGWAVSWMGVSKQSRQTLKDKLAGVGMGDKARADLVLAIDKLGSDRNKAVEEKLHQAFDAFKANALEEGWFSTAYCDAWCEARKSQKEVEGYIQSSIAKRFNAGEAVLIDISKRHETLFSKHFSSLSLKGDAASFLSAQGHKLKSIFLDEQSDSTFKNSIVTYWDSRYRSFWESFSTEVEQHYIEAKGSVIAKSAPWKNLRRAASLVRGALTQSGDMLFSFDVVARQAVLGVFDREIAKAYGMVLNSKSDDRRTQLDEIRDKLENSESGAQASYYLQEAIVAIEADHASTSLGFNIALWQKPSRAVIALKRVRLECEDAAFLPKSDKGLLVPVLNRAQDLIRSYFAQFRVASLFERQYTKRLLDSIIQQQAMVRGSSKDSPYTIADACYGISECVNTIYDEVKIYNESKIWTKLVQMFGGNADSSLQRFLKNFCASMNNVQQVGGGNAYYQFSFFAANSREVVVERLRRAKRLISEADVSFLSKLFNGQEHKDKVLTEVRACISAVERHRGDPKNISLTIHALHDYLERVGEGYAKTLKTELDWLADRRHLKSRSDITGISEQDAQDGSVLSEYHKELRKKTVEQEQAVRAIIKKARP